MAEKQTEMSLDEMLSSIKQMVIDKDPPVLELTDMISPDGTIVKVCSNQNNYSSKNEMRDFLRLAQEESNTSLSKALTNNSEETDDPAPVKNELTPNKTVSNQVSSQKIGITVRDVIREIATPIVEKWLEKNLKNLVKEVVTAEVQNMIKQS